MSGTEKFRRDKTKNKNKRTNKTKYSYDEIEDILTNEDYEKGLNPNPTKIEEQKEEILIEEENVNSSTKLEENVNSSTKLEENIDFSKKLEEEYIEEEEFNDDYFNQTVVK